MRLDVLKQVLVVRVKSINHTAVINITLSTAADPHAVCCTTADRATMAECCHNRKEPPAMHCKQGTSLLQCRFELRKDQHAAPINFPRPGNTTMPLQPAVKDREGSVINSKSLTGGVHLLHSLLHERTLQLTPPLSSSCMRGMHRWSSTSHPNSYTGQCT